jgi:MYXO-CTERM domain-containing protein
MALAAFALFALTLAVEGPTLQLPWACGTEERCTQDHNGGSHTGASAWAWDFALQDGEEIWAASAGTVTHVEKGSTVSGCNSAYAADANFVTIDHGDGTSIIYAHMQTGSIPLDVGDVVEVGDLIGKVGQTGYSCGAHLHMAVQDQCGSSHCQSVSAAFAERGDPQASTTYESNNCPACSRVLDGGVTIVDDRDAGCLSRVTTSWWSSMEGHDAHHFYTFATDNDAPVSSATWLVHVATPGDYLVEVFVPGDDADTENARYLVHHDAGASEIAVSQAVAKGWQPLGTFSFSAPEGQGVELGDATGENIDTLERRIAFDAMRFTFVPSAGEEGSGGDSTSTSGGDDDSSGGSSTGEEERDTTTGSSGDASESSDGLPPSFGDAGDRSGCGCRTAAPPPAAMLLLVLLGRRRRR